MFRRFLLFLPLFLAAAATWTVIAAIIVAEVLDPVTLFDDDHVAAPVFLIAAVPLLISAYPVHRRYVADWDDASLRNLLAYLAATLFLTGLAFGAFSYIIEAGHATASEALVPYTLLSIAALWFGGLWTLNG